VLVAELIRLGADPNYPDPAGFTEAVALMRESRSKKTQAAR
jgi:hypothetical protein